MKILQLVILFATASLIGCYDPVTEAHDQSLIPHARYAVTAVEVAGNCGGLLVTLIGSDSEGHLVFDGCANMAIHYVGSTVHIDEMVCERSTLKFTTSSTVLFSDDRRNGHGSQFVTFATPFKCASSYEVFYNLVTDE